jgi:hypothetical protein
MNSLFRNTNITWRTFQDDALVIFPVSVSDSKSAIDEMQFLIIGDPRNEGRYKTAMLKGRLLDGKNGNPLPGAVVQETRSHKGTSTDAGGYFALELATGEGNLQFSYLGYQPAHQKIRLIENGYAEFDIFEESHNITEVTITGKDADLPRAQMSMISMEVNRIKELPVLMGEVDITRGITMQAGVQTVSELSSGFNIRGGNISCISTPGKVVLGNFEIASVKEYRFYVEPNGQDNYFIKRIPHFWDIPQDGKIQYQAPVWWETRFKDYSAGK